MTFSCIGYRYGYFIIKSGGLCLGLVRSQYSPCGFKKKILGNRYYQEFNVFKNTKYMCESLARFFHSGRAIRLKADRIKACRIRVHHDGLFHHAGHFDFQVF